MNSYDDLRRIGVDNLARLVMKCERENAILREENGRIVKDLNFKLQEKYAEIRDFMKRNQDMLDENQDLSELCLYLDDERLRLSRLVEEWQKFGQYYFHNVMSNVDSCRDEIKNLEMAQNSLLKENSELKEDLVSSASITNILRRGGDGSSSPGPSVEADGASKVPNPSAVFLSPPFSDSDDNSNKNLQFSNQTMSNQFTSQSIKLDIKNNYQKYDKLWRRDTSEVCNDDTNSVSNNTNKSNNKNQKITNNYTNNSSNNTATSNFYHRSSSLNRPSSSLATVSAASAAPSLTSVLYSHPFQKVSSTPSLALHDEMRQQQQLAAKLQPPYSSTSSRYQPMASQQSYKPPASQPPPPSSTYPHYPVPRPHQNYPQHIIGYHPVEDDQTHMRSVENNQHPGKIDASWKRMDIPEQDRKEAPYNYKTSF